MGYPGIPGANLNDAVKMDYPENHAIEPKIWLYLGHNGSYDSLKNF